MTTRTYWRILSDKIGAAEISTVLCTEVLRFGVQKSYRTSVLGGTMDGQEAYSLTKPDAEYRHVEMVSRVRNQQTND